MIFPSTISSFCHPTSTTKQITVAQQFATNYGSILQLNTPYFGYGVPCFSCSWISSFGNEDEILFIGGYNPLKIINIISCIDGKEYKKYLNVLNILSKCIDGKWMNDDDCDSLDISVCDSLFFFNYECSSLIPKYFANIFHSFTNNTKYININIKYLKESSYFLSLLLSSSKDLSRTFINLKNIKKIFKNVEKIAIFPGYGEYILLSSSYFNVVSSYLMSYSIKSLKEIIICRVKVDKGTVFDLLNSVKVKFEKSTNFILKYDNKYQYLYISKL